VFTAATAHAEEPGGETIRVEGKVPDGVARDRDRALGDAPFVTILHADDHPATASVADAIATSAGAQRRSLGGFGAFSSISVRGASPGHTAVLVDGVPLAKLAQVTVDLGRFAMDSFSEVELYRGAVPLELGGAGVGGAVNMITRLGRGPHGEKIQASIGGGSYGARHARLHYGDDHGSVLSAINVGYQGATGDFAFFTDNGTPLNRTDDTTLVRRNNEFDQVDASGRLGTDVGVAGARVLWKRQGLPGSIATPALDAGMSTVDVILDGRGDATVGKARARQLGYVFVEAQALHDREGELGLGAADRRYLTLAGGVSSTWMRPLGVRDEHGSGDRGTAALELRGERFRDGDADGMRDDLVGTRAAIAGSTAIDLQLGKDLVVTPAVRVDLVRTAPTPMTVGPDAFRDFDPRWDVLPSPRFTARVALHADVALKSSAGYYTRLPTLLELFGDRGFVVGSPDLRPERGQSMDAGLVWAPAKSRGSVDRVFVEAVGFATHAKDTIALITTAGFVARAENVGSTHSYGGELVMSGRLAKLVSLTASYTRVVAEQRAIDPNIDGKDIPRIPGHVLSARAELAGRPRVLRDRLASLRFDVAAQSKSFLDRANNATVPGRVLLGASSRVEVGRGFAIALAADNLANTRVVEIPPMRAIDVPLPIPLSDVAGFPLPGRTFYLALDWTH
jgi:iron complex outermembrane receptor protein